MVKIVVVGPDDVLDAGTARLIGRAYIFLRNHDPEGAFAVEFVLIVEHTGIQVGAFPVDGQDSLESPGDVYGAAVGPARAGFGAVVAPAVGVLVLVCLRVIVIGGRGILVALPRGVGVDMVHVQALIVVERMELGPAVRCVDHDAARIGEVYPRVVQEVLHGDPRVGCVEVSGPARVHEQELGVLRHGGELRPRIHAGRCRNLGRIVVRVSRVTAEKDLGEVREPVPVRIEIGDVFHGRLRAPPAHVIKPVRVEGVEDVPAAVISILVVAPLAAPQGGDLPAALVRSTAVAQGTVIELGSGLLRIDAQELRRVVLSLVMVGTPP
ncbi:MAG: hypothetical protein BWX71_02593 [Deltaproteobacteria bacterium ADurb.Bin072]|nr:MAG: hypothetical protein BWX71_02593 [Deltaproteobacteria bacterium ADurb.Bin072]